MRSLVALATVAAWFAAPAAWAQEEVDVRPATRSAEAWLELIDGGQYGASWDAGAATFREAIARLKWETSLQDARAQLGAVVKRKLRSARHARNLPNSPAGEYVVIENEARFEGRPLATETITLMKQADGSWRVAGYFIH
jgi:hypothetical protein